MRISIDRDTALPAPQDSSRGAAAFGAPAAHAAPRASGLARVTLERPRAV